MNDEQYQVLSAKVAALEAEMQTVNDQLGRLLAIFERGSGAWWLLKRLGAVAVGVAAIWATVSDHIHWR